MQFRNPLGQQITMWSVITSPGAVGLDRVEHFTDSRILKRPLRRAVRENGRATVQRSSSLFWGKLISDRLNRPGWNRIPYEATSTIQEMNAVTDRHRG